MQYFCEKCILLGLGNSSVILSRYNSVQMRARKKKENIIFVGCPCYVTNNAVKVVTDPFDSITGFGVEEMLEVVYFHFDNSSRLKTLLVKFCKFCDHDYSKKLTFHSV